MKKILNNWGTASIKSHTMKILIAATFVGTLRTFLIPYAKYLKGEGHEVHAVSSKTSTCNKCKSHFDKVFDVTWYRNPLRCTNFQTVSSIRKIVKNENYDIVHVHTPVASFLTRYALKNFSDSERPVIIYTAHGFHFHSRGSFINNVVFRNIEKIAGNWTDYLIVINKADKKAAKKNNIVPEDRIIHMPGVGLDTSEFCISKIESDAKKGFRQEIGLNSDDYLFLMIAEFNPGKRHKDLINAFSEIPNKNVHLVFAGKGQLREKIQDQVNELGLTKRVHFLGFRGDIKRIIASSQAIVLPSEREGLPRSVMEAMSMEKPVIGTKIRGTSELLGSGAGILIEVGNIDALKKAIQCIVNNPEKAKRMGKIGKNVVQKYDISNLLKMHDQLYQKITKRAL